VLNSDRYLEYYVAVPWAGAVVVPLNTRWSEAELTYALNDSGATCLFLDDAFLKHAAALLGQVASLRRIVYLGEQSTPPCLVGYEGLIDGNAPLADAGCGGGDRGGAPLPPRPPPHFHRGPPVPTPPPGNPP